jgi:hypothetical protein
VNVKKYRACLLGLIIIMFVIGTFIYIASIRDDEISGECVLVDAGDGAKDSSDKAVYGS